MIDTRSTYSHAEQIKHLGFYFQVDRRRKKQAYMDKMNPLRYKEKKVRNIPERVREERSRNWIRSNSRTTAEFQLRIFAPTESW